MSQSFLQSLAGQNPTPEVNYNFVVFLGMDIFGAFQAVEDLEIEIPSYQYNEGGRNFAPRSLPFDGPMAPGRVTLSWGTPSWTTLYTWMHEVDVGNAFRREVVITQLGRSGWPTRIIALHGAWPVNWKGANLNASQSDWALESITLVYERMLMSTPPGAGAQATIGASSLRTGTSLKGG